MTTAEECGHGRRGEIRYVRGSDGEEIISVEEIPERWERDGQVNEAIRRRRSRILADDLPWIVSQYRKHTEGHPIEAHPWEPRTSSRESMRDRCVR